MANAGSQQRGFTLIEMSIVLVIIGLIVGGILKGQEVIESARQKNMASLYDQLRSGQNTFLDRYRALPGDYAEASTKINSLAGDGDGDGFIGTLQASQSNLASAVGSTGEPVKYFNQLIAAGLFGGGQVIDESTSSAATTFSGGKTASPLPPGPWTHTGLMVVHGTHEGATGAGASKTNPWLRLSQFATGAMSSTTGALSGHSAFQLDQKFDDGLPATGRIRNTGVNTSICGSITTNAYVPTASANAQECDVLFSMD